MGNFGSKGGLRRFVPVDQERSSDKKELSHFFRRKKVGTEFQEIQSSQKENLIREMILQSNLEKKNEGGTDRSAEGLQDSAGDGVIK